MVEQILRCCNSLIQNDMRSKIYIHILLKRRCQRLTNQIADSYIKAGNPYIDTDHTTAISVKINTVGIFSSSGKPTAFQYQIFGQKGFYMIGNSGF